MIKIVVMPTFIEKYIIRAKHLPVPSRRRPGTPCDTIRFIVVHDTGNPGSSANGNVDFYINTSHTVEKKASAHLFVDDKEIIECIPALMGTPEKAWHVLYNRPKDNELFGADANDAAIGVEYCYGGRIDADKAYQKYVWVIAKLCFAFNLDPSRSVVGHFFLDPQRKTDPVTGLLQSRRTYEQLLVDIVNEFKACTGAQDTVLNYNEISQTGSVTATAKLNIRKQPTRLSEKVQQVVAGTTLNYTAIINNGERVNNNTIWYKDAAGNYFWSGGTK